MKRILKAFCLVAALVAAGMSGWAQNYSFVEAIDKIKSLIVSTQLMEIEEMGKMDSVRDRHMYAFTTDLKCANLVVNTWIYLCENISGQGYSQQVKEKMNTSLVFWYGALKSIGEYTEAVDNGTITSDQLIRASTLSGDLLTKMGKDAARVRAMMTEELF